MSPHVQKAAYLLGHRNSLPVAQFTSLQKLVSHPFLFRITYLSLESARRHLTTFEVILVLYEHLL